MAIIEDSVTNEDGQVVKIYFEVDDESAYSDGRETRGGECVLPAQDVFTKAMSLIRTCAEQVAKTVREVPDTFQPDGFEVQFAVKADTSVGVVIARSTAEAQIQVTLRWGKEEV